MWCIEPPESLDVTAFLNLILPDCWATHWSPVSPDITSLEIFLWRREEFGLYNPIANLETLKTITSDVIVSVTT
jgi:hypothetical protein